MARMLPAIASAFVRFLQRENRRPFFARRRRLRRFGNVTRRLGRFRHHGHGAGIRRYDNGRHRARHGGQHRPFNWNRRRHDGRRQSHPRQAPVPATEQSARQVAADVVGPSAPPPPAFSIPPMDWLLGRPVAQDDFNAALVPLPPGILFDNGMDAGVAFCPKHGYGPCPARKGYEASTPPSAAPPPVPEVVDDPDAYLDIPTPTPTLSDEDPEHFMPPGYGPVPGLNSPLPPPDEEAGAPLAAAPFSFDLNIEVEPEDEETSAPVEAAPFAFDLHAVELEDKETGAPVAAAPFSLDLSVKVEPEDEELFVAALASPPAQAPLPAGPPTPPPKARRLLRRFAAAMASRQPGFRAGSSDPASLGFSNEQERGEYSSGRRPAVRR